MHSHYGLYERTVKHVWSLLKYNVDSDEISQDPEIDE